MSPKHRERRKTTRIPYATELSIHYRDSLWRAQSREISLDGMFIESMFFPTLGAEILIGLELPELGIVSIPAFVRWVDKTGFGVQFDSLGARETHAIQVLMKQIKP